MSSNESAAYKIMRSLDVDYVLIIFGGVIGYSGDDINKFLWMVRIAEGEHPKDIRVSGSSSPVSEFYRQASKTARHIDERKEVCSTGDERISTNWLLLLAATVNGIVERLSTRPIIESLTPQRC